MEHQRFPLNIRGFEDHPAFWSDYPPATPINDYRIDPDKHYPVSELNKGKLGECRIEQEGPNKYWFVPLFEVIANAPEFYAFWDVDKDAHAKLSTVLMTLERANAERTSG
jgi:hypothetical protein